MLDQVYTLTTVQVWVIGGVSEDRYYNGGWEVSRRVVGWEKGGRVGALVERGSRGRREKEVAW